MITIHKPIGLTPLEVINKLKENNPELTQKKISYAGRLDPLAQGLLLLTIDEESKDKEAYLGLPKTYEFTVVFGLETDSYDMLGYVNKINRNNDELNVNIFVNSFVNTHLGKQLQSYPPYSSRTVNGKPLFWYAKNNKLSEIKIPTHKIEIYDFTLLSIEETSLHELQQKAEQAIASVHGDFRQEMILKRWREISTNAKTTLPTATFRITCSSGTYIRALTHQMGKELGSGAIASDILRTAIGNYTLKGAIKI